MIAPKVKSAIEVITTKAVCANNQFLRFNGSMNPTSAIKDEITINPPTTNPPKEISILI